MTHRTKVLASGPRTLGLITVFTALALSPGARASSADKPAADALFLAARQLMEKGDFANACPKLADSQRLDPAVGTLLNLALCYEKNGQTASAWSAYREAAAAARDKGQTEREENARAAAQRLEAGLLKVIISVAPQPDGNPVFVKIDTTPLPAGLYGLETPVDPGKHQLEASAPGKKLWVTSFELQPGPTATVSVPVLELEPIVPASASQVPGSAGPSANDGHAQRTAGLIVGGVGVAAVGVGTVFGLMADASYSGSKNLCNGDHCTEAGHEDRQRAFDQATVATIGFAVGGAALVGSAILWFTAPKANREQPTALSVGPILGAGTAGLQVGGRL